jgi:hypothetical protein
MRFDRFFLPALSGLLIACGSGASGAAANDIVGRLFVTTDGTSSVDANRFEIDLQPFTPANPCADADRIVGACCFFGPKPRPPTQGPGISMPSTEASAGSIELADATTSATIGTFTYAGGGYTPAFGIYAPGSWSPGDDLRITAAGDQIGAFTITAPALSPAQSILPAKVVRGSDLVVTWAPDAASESMSISLLDTLTGAEVACKVPEQEGTVTIDASLFASFNAGPSCETAAIRETDRFVQTPEGRVELASLGWATAMGTVE